MASANRAVSVPQLTFSRGDRLLVHAKPSSEWWWAELDGVTGYAPADYLRQDAAEEEEDTSLEDPWQDEEYFGSYGTLVRNIKGSLCFTCYNLMIYKLHTDISKHNTRLKVDLQPPSEPCNFRVVAINTNMQGPETYLR